MNINGTHVTITLSDDPIVAARRWVAIREDDQFVIFLSSTLTEWERSVACLEAVTDSEYDAYARTLPVEEQVRREVDRTFGMTARESLIRKRTALGRAERWGPFIKSLPVLEQERRQVDVRGEWSTDVPAFA